MHHYGNIDKDDSWPLALKMALKLAQEFAQELAQELAQGLVQEHGDAVVASLSFYIGL